MTGGFFGDFEILGILGGGEGVGLIQVGISWEFQNNLWWPRTSANKVQPTGGGIGGNFRY